MHTRNGVLILNTNEFVKEFLPLTEYDEFDIVIISGGDIKYNRKTPNVVTADGLMPNMLCVNYLDGGSELSEDYRKFKKEYLRHLDKPINRQTLASILFKAVCSDRPVCFLCSLSESKTRYLEILADVIRDRFGIKVQNFNYFKGNPEGLIIHNKEEVKRRLLMELIQFEAYSKQAEDYIEYCDVTVPLSDPGKILDMKWKNVVKVGILVNVKYRKWIKKDDYIKEILLTLKTRKALMVPKREALEEFYSEKDLYMLARYYRIKLEDDASREDIIDAIETYRNNLVTIKAPSFYNLTKMTDKELMVQCKMAGIDYEEDSKPQLIKALLSHYGDDIENPTDNISKESLKKMNIEELYKLAISLGIDTDLFKLMDLKTIRHTILAQAVKEETLKKYSSFNLRDLTRMEPKRLVKLAMDLDCLDRKPLRYYYNVSKDELVEIVARGLHIEEGKVEPMKIPKRKKLLEMKKSQLIEIANSHQLGVTDLEKKHFIIEQLLDLREDLKKFKAEQEENADYNSAEEHLETLMGCTKERLERFCVKNKIAYDPSWSKKKLCKVIISKYDKVNLKKNKKKVKTPDVSFDKNFFTYDNLILLHRDRLLDICKLYFIDYNESMNKKELMMAIESHFHNGKKKPNTKSEWDGVVQLAVDEESKSKLEKKLKKKVSEDLSNTSQSIFTNFDDIRKEENIEEVALKNEDGGILSLSEKIGKDLSSLKFKI